jgi:hypothetical protein
LPHPRLRRVGSGLATVEFSLRNEVLRAQFGIALQVLLRQLGFGFGSHPLCLCCGRRQRVVAGVERSNRLPRLDLRADLNRPRLHPACHPKRQNGLITRVYFTGVARAVVRSQQTSLLGPHGSDIRRWGRRRFTTTRG